MATGYDDEEIGSEDGDGWEDDMEDSAEGPGSGDANSRLANRRRGKGTGNPGKPGKKLRLADLQSQFGVGLKVCGLAVFICCSICLLQSALCMQSIDRQWTSSAAWEIEAYAWMAFMSVLDSRWVVFKLFFLMPCDACCRKPPTS